MMINGNMEFENIPLETIINEFIRKTDFEKLKTIEKIKKEFVKFINGYAPTSSAEDYLSFVIERFKEIIKFEIEEKGFDKFIKIKQRKEIYPFIKSYFNYYDEFKDIIPQNRNVEKYTKILWEIFCHDLRYEGTGIIIAGNSIDSPYPSFFEINIHCNDSKEIIYEEIESKIDFEETIIRIYAMNEEGYTFFTGVNEEFIEYIGKYINKTKEEILESLEWNLKNENISSTEKILNIVKKVLDEEYIDLDDEINHFRLETIKDTSKSIEFIPNNILCILADEIIRLTAIKQKISSENEYVSMKSHISLMSKSNGFKWVKFDDEIL